MQLHQIISNFGQLDVFAGNAAMTMHQPALEIYAENIQATFGLNA